MKKIRLLIIDDSALIRTLLTEIFNSSSAIEVVGTAADPYIARDKIKRLNPDVLTLDIEMPRMNGLTFLRNLMRLRPIPVVMISTLTERGAEVTLEALKLGAVDFVSKPQTDLTHVLKDYAEEMIDKVVMAAGARLQDNEFKPTLAKPIETDQPAKGDRKNRIIALGASTGGTEAIKKIAASLPKNTPAIVISQHLPVAFSASFARHVDEVSAMTVTVAEHGQKIVPGHIYIAPGDKHLKIAREKNAYLCLIDDSEPVNRHKPSVDVMFRSVAQNVGKHAVGVMLTGMGVDGAAAMKEMREAGAFNIVQDESSSVVWGMPGEAYAIGAADVILPLDKIADQIVALTQ